MPTLVRDRIPELFGGQSRPLDETEFLESGELLELADLLDVLYALARLDGVSAPELERQRAAKAEERGSFERRLWWNADVLTPD